ncbi:hypothetical protein IHE45_09G061500 [Dioscorea alata]|uniref:Uncharacterized protein n=1 Tax=Dioscorea alata TaxID=55571 RepID=A0ACB7VFQ9_DIOAL|nr:hypothetical protein IHE45_09G061500 [Dioscorea alata]
MLSIKQDLPQHHLHMDQDHKFFSKLLSKDISSSSSSSSPSSSSPSFRVYYGVPFMWESQPGTSKYTLPTITTTLPPLTPPPSFYTNQITKITKKSFTSNLFKSMLPKLNLKKTHAFSSSSSISFSSSSISSLSSPSSLSLFSFTSSHRHSRFSSARMSFSSFGEDHEDQLNEVPLNSSSSLCFPLRSPYRRNGEDRRGCLKKSFLSTIRLRSTQAIA